MDKRRRTLITLLGGAPLMVMPLVAVADHAALQAPRSSREGDDRREPEGDEERDDREEHPDRHERHDHEEGENGGEVEGRGEPEEREERSEHRAARLHRLEEEYEHGRISRRQYLERRHEVEEGGRSG